MAGSVSMIASPVVSAQLGAVPRAAATSFSLPLPVVNVPSNATSISGSSVVSAAVGDRTSSAYGSSASVNADQPHNGAPGMNSELASQQAEMRDLISLQIAMQRENQYFTAISNILKTRHETLKTIIGNIR